MLDSWRPLSTTLIAAVMAVTAVLADHPGSGNVTVAAGDRGRPTSAPSRVSMSSGSAKDFWTPTRMARAKPMERERGRRPRMTDSSALQRRPHSIAGIAVPNDDDGRVVKAAQDQPALTYPFPFGRRRVEIPLGRVAPYRVVGRVFFRQRDAEGVWQSYACSGSSVISGPRQVVFTAGHCLNDGGGTGPAHWSRDVVFVPARRPGKNRNPYGIFPAKELWVPEGWSSAGLYAYDLGAFHVGRNAKGKRLQKVVGALGFAYDYGRVQHWDIFGYPAAPPFKRAGNQLITCASAFATQQVEDGGPDATGVGCDMSGGSSGGPWILRLRRGNLLNGIVSYGLQAQPAALYTPYFDATANNLRCAAATGNQNATSC
jgi:V8-like Glu-specific endopeptidase